MSIISFAVAPVANTTDVPDVTVTSVVLASGATAGDIIDLVLVHSMLQRLQLHPLRQAQWQTQDYLQQWQVKH